MQTSISSSRRLSPKQCVCLGAAFLLGLSGCGQVAPSKTATGAGTGAVVGALGGAAVGANSSMGTGAGLVGGAAAGALVGGIIGMVQDARDKREQDSLAQQRAYQQDLAKKRAEEARIKASMEEELQARQGFRITDLELSEATRREQESADLVKRLEAEKAAAIARTKDLNDKNEKNLANEAKAAALQEELARLKSDDPLQAVQSASPQTPQGGATSATANPPVTPAP